MGSAYWVVHDAIFILIDIGRIKFHICIYTYQSLHIHLLYIFARIKDREVCLSVDKTLFVAYEFNNGY